MLASLFFISPVKLISLTFGKEYIPSIPSIKILIPALFLLSITSFLGSLIASVNVPRSGPLPGFLILVLNIILNFLLIQKFQTTGAAIASFICYGLFIPYTSYYTYKILSDENYVPKW